MLCLNSNLHTNYRLAHTTVLTYLVHHTHILSTVLTAQDSPCWGKIKINNSPITNVQWASARHGKELPPGLDASLNRALVQITAPFPSRRIRAGMMVNPKHQNRDLSRFPIAVSCGIAIPNGIPLMYSIVSDSEAHSKQTQWLSHSDCAIMH
jgi:hypothetical protein